MDEQLTHNWLVIFTPFNKPALWTFNDLSFVICAKKPNTMKDAPIIIHVLFSKYSILITIYSYFFGFILYLYQMDACMPAWLHAYSRKEDKSNVLQLLDSFLFFFSLFAAEQRGYNTFLFKVNAGKVHLDMVKLATKVLPLHRIVCNCHKITIRLSFLLLPILYILFKYKSLASFNCVFCSSSRENAIELILLPFFFSLAAAGKWSLIFSLFFLT